MDFIAFLPFYKYFFTFAHQKSVSIIFLIFFSQFYKIDKNLLANWEFWIRLITQMARNMDRKSLEKKQFYKDWIELYRM